MRLMASDELHRLDPEAYLPGLIRVLGHYPIDRAIELAPQYGLST